MSCLSDLFGDLGDEDDDEEEDYRPDADQISDIESAEEMDSAPSNNVITHESRSFSLGDELLKPLKPPEFDSDEEITTNRNQEKRRTISSDDEEQDAQDIRQLNKNLFGSDNESDDDVPSKSPKSSPKPSPKSSPTPSPKSSPKSSPKPSPKPSPTSSPKSSTDQPDPIAIRPLQNADDFFKDSDDEEKVNKSSKTTAADLFGSDIDDDSDVEKPADSAAAAATQQDIFGSDLSMSDEEQAPKRASPKADSSKAGSDEEPTHSRLQHSDGESEEEKVDEESELPVEMPLTDIKLGENLNLIKLPNFVSIDTRPFDADTYEDEIEDDHEVTDDEGRARLKLKVENTIRWRHALDDQGNLIRQSNSKVVKWSDGSMSLFVGAEEFDILKAPLTGANSHLYVKHGAGIQGQAQFHSKMMFRIHSTDSYTHRKLTMRISDRVSKASKAKTLPAVGTNPETRREEMCKKEDERQAAQRRRENMQKKMREKNMNKTINTRYLEPDIEEDEDGESLAAIKNSYKSGAKKKQKTAQKKVSEVYSSEEEEEEPLLSEEEEEAVPTESDSEDDKKRQKKKPAVIDDEEESD